MEVHAICVIMMYQTKIDMWLTPKYASKTFWKSRISTTQKMKFSIKDFLSKCDQIRSFLRISSHVLKNPSWKISFFALCSTCAYHWVRTIIVDKIYGTMSRNLAKLDRTRTLWNMFLLNIWPLVPNFYMWNDDWVLGSASSTFCDIPNIS